MVDMLEALYWGPAAKGTARQLVVLCHGLGADAHDLADLAPEWGDGCPDALFASVHAPFLHPSGWGRQWWEVGDRSPEIMLEGARTAAAHLDTFLDAELARLGVTDYALMGFSQGAMTVLFTGLRRAIAPRAILAYSGALVAPETLAAEIRNRAPVTIVHGEADDVVPVGRSRAAEASLRSLGVPVEATYIPGLGHGIDQTGLATGAAALGRPRGGA